MPAVSQKATLQLVLRRALRCPEAPAACIKEALQDQATPSQNGTFGGFGPGAGSGDVGQRRTILSRRVKVILAIF